MPLEIKNIYFTDSELRKALINFSGLHNQFLELNDIKKVVIENVDEIQITMLIDKALEFEDDEISFSHAEVAAALLAFCMAVKIPLPKEGSKELHANNDNIYLKVRYQQDVDFETYKICNTLQNSSYAHY